MLRNIGIVLMLGAALCALPPIFGWFEYGRLLWPGFTIGGLLDGLSLANRLGPIQPFLYPLFGFNPGWFLLLLGLGCFLVARNRDE